MAASYRIQILSVGNCILFRRGLRAIVHDQPNLLLAGETTSDPTEVAEMVTSLQPHVLVADGGIEQEILLGLCHAARAQSVGIGLVVLARSPYREGKMGELLQAGVNGIVAADDEQQVVHALSGAAHHERLLHVQLPCSDGSTLSPFVDTAKKVPLDSEDIQLLEMLAAGCTDGEIADKFVLSLPAVRHRIERKREATGTRNRVALAAWAGKNGYYK